MLMKAKSVFWIIFSLIIIACVVLGVIYREWIKNKWTEITHPQTSGIITGYFKVTDGTKDNNIVFVMQVTEDKIIVKNINVELVNTDVDDIKEENNSVIINDVEFNVNEVYYEEANAIRFSFADSGYGPFTLIPDYVKKTYDINSLNDKAKDYKVIKINEEEFEKITILVQE